MANVCEGFYDFIWVEQQLHLDIVTNVLFVVQNNVQRMHIINND